MANLAFRLKKRWNKKSSFRWNKTSWFNQWKAQKSVHGFELLRTFSCFISAVSGCVSISELASLVNVPVGIASSAVGLKVCAIIAGNISQL